MLFDQMHFNAAEGSFRQVVGKFGVRQSGFCSPESCRIHDGRTRYHVGEAARDRIGHWIKAKGFRQEPC